MNDKINWAGRTSPLLFIYEYIAICIIAVAVQKYIGGHVFVYALPAILYFYFKARSMKYVISDSDVYFSPSIGDNESITVMLTKIQAIQVVDRQPWKFFRLGTIILITNPDEEMQPCMKCLNDPHGLASSIRTKAYALGAPHFPIDTI